MSYMIIRPYQGVTVNKDLEYLKDSEGKPLMFATRHEAVTFVRKNVTTEAPQEYVWQYKWYEIPDNFEKDNACISE